MKKAFLLLIASISVVSCSKVGKNEFIINGKVDGLKDGTVVYLQKQDSTGNTSAIDTVKIEKNKFTFTGPIKDTDIYLIQIENTQGKVPLVLETGEIDVKVNKDSLQLAQVTGTYNNDELNGYRTDQGKLQKKMMKFQKDNMMKMNEARQKNDTVFINGLKKEYGKLQKEGEEMSEKYVTSHPKAYISILIIQSMFSSMTPDIPKLTKLFNSLDAEVKNTKAGIKTKKTLDKFSATAIGNKAPEFSGPNPQGETVSLKGSLGKATIIDFWASWCKPCREANPGVVALYNEYHAKGLNIISVSLDKDNTAWKEAIAKDQLNWNHISNLKYWEEPIARQYNIYSVPATFLLDASGKIVAKDLSGAELKAKVASLLGA